VLAALPPGTWLTDRYRVDGVLGAGGFGVVYAATQHPLGREVALKVVASPLGGSVDRFREEARLAMRLEHPNTVRILDAGEGADGLPFIVYERLRGETLAQMIARSGPIPPATALRIAAQVLKGLMEAHGLGIVHRDIKPANVFVTSHPGEPVFAKILDFGIAKDLRGTGGVGGSGTYAPAAGTTAAGSSLVGTPLYMAPEQARGEVVTPLTDLYAVGLLLLEMLTGRPPMDPSLGLGAIVRHHASDVGLSLPPALDASFIGALLRRSLSRDVAGRFPSAGAMLAEVERLGETSGLATLASGSADGAVAVHAPTLQAPTPLPDSRARRSSPARTSWHALLLVAVVTAALVGVVVALLLPRGRSPRGPEEAPTDNLFEPPSRAPLDPNQRRFDLTVEEAVARLKEQGYTLESQVTLSDPYRMHGYVAKRAPCGGAITFFDFGTAAAARDFKSALGDYGVLVLTDTRLVQVALYTARDRLGPRAADAVPYSRACSDAAVESITEPL
jgi:serine/threonine protein kinase